MAYLKEKISNAFYYHGMFCASHPVTILIFVISLVLFICHPLSELRLPGEAPQEHSTPCNNYTVPLSVDEHLGPRWFQGQPIAFIQQIVIRSTVSPWDRKKLVRTDAYRVTLSKVFDVLEKINQFVYLGGNMKLGVSDLCLHVSGVNQDAPPNVFPEYGCLILSPANLWNLDKERLDSDSNLMKTIYSTFGKKNISPPLKDLIFGIPWIQSGISRLSIRNRQRVISYAITIAFKKYNKNFINDLRHKLEKSFSQERADNMTNQEIVHIHFLSFRDFKELVEYFPLFMTYVVLFFYLYFSVRKIEMVKSKWGLALSAVAMVITSLLSSVAICAYFGITPSLNGGEIFPYLVLFVGFENVLVLTKSVVSTPVDLDVKMRIAEGISKEGWSITKNLLAELLILTFGFVTFVPDIQEFCVFAVVGLLTDFFLQMVFFVTVLSIDIRRMELSDLHKKGIRSRLSQFTPTSPPYSSQHSSTSGAGHCPVLNQLYAPLQEVDKTPTISLVGQQKKKPSNVFFGDYDPEPTYCDPNILKLPRRIRLLYFWANTRVVQRFIMVCTVIWIVLILYKSGLVMHFVQIHLLNATKQKDFVFGHSSVDMDEFDSKGYQLMSDDLSTLNAEEHWNKLSYSHWPVLLSYYNLSLERRYLSLLPSIRLNILVPLSEAIAKRHPSEQIAIEQTKIEQSTAKPKKLLLYPTSGWEVVITVLIGSMGIMLTLYMVMLLYKCLCSKNYARWRSSWHKSGRRTKHAYVHRIQESMPLCMRGHIHEIETIISDGGTLVVSSCLGGQIRTWDISTGMCVMHMPRYVCATSQVNRTPCPGRNIHDSDLDLYNEYHEPIESTYYSVKETSLSKRHRSLPDDTIIETLNLESSDQTKPQLTHRRAHYYQDYPDLSSTIQMEFSSIKPLQVEESKTKGYDFEAIFDEHYQTHKKYSAEKHDFYKAREEKRKSESEYSPSKSLVNRQRSYSDSADGILRAGGDARKSRTTSEGSDSLDELLETNTAVWCLASQNNLVLAGCANGRVEIWDGLTGELKTLYEGGQIGVTALCFIGKKIIAARFDGSLDFLEIEFFRRPLHVHRRGSRDVHDPLSYSSWSENLIRCFCVVKTQAHQQPITCLLCEGGRVVTGSQDNTLKVYRLEDSLCLFTLHGHTDSVTALHLDKVIPMVALSGSQDGDVRAWDLLTGSCVHQLSCHTGPVTSLTCTSDHYISCSMDDRLCIWERPKGYLIHCIQLDPGYCNSMSSLTDNLLITGGQGCLMLWDVCKGVRLRTIRLGNSDHTVFVRQLITLTESVVVCDYGSELRVVHFPKILDKKVE